VFFEPCIWFRVRALIAILPALLLFGPAGEARCDAIRGEGDFEFYVDISSLPAGARGTIQLIQLAVPTRDLRYVQKAGTYGAEVRFSVVLRSGKGIVHQKTFQIKDTRDAMPKVKDLSAFLYAIDSCYADPGSYRLTVKVEDLQRRKKTLLGILHGTYLCSMVSDAEIDVEAFPAGVLVLADPILVWGFDRAGRFIPNPMQLYGLRKDTLSLYVQAALPERSTADSMTVHLALNKETGEVMADELFKVPVSGHRSAFTRNIDLTTYTAGAYHVTVEARTGNEPYASTGKDFNVAWELMNWQKPVRDVLVEARILFRDKEFEAFEQMSIGEQEAFLKAFWRKLDPTPQTAVNEVYQKFTARVKYADSHFGSFERGALTDRGVTYIRLGPPDEIIHQPLPGNRDDLYEGIDKVMTEYKIIADGIMSDKVVKDLRPVIISPEKQRATRGLVGDDVGAFEIWNYNFKGDPILPDDRGMTMRQGLRFLFLDKDGFGAYRLAGSSEEMSTGEPE
jgi:GWxTD domain-containing protein